MRPDYPVVPDGEFAMKSTIPVTRASQSITRWFVKSPDYNGLSIANGRFFGLVLERHSDVSFEPNRLAIEQIRLERPLVHSFDRSAGE